MHILFDLYIQKPELMDTASKEERTCMAIIHHRVASRLALLKDDIEKEETEIEEKTGKMPYIEVVLLKNPSYIRFHFYSDGLKEKMQASFTPADGQLIEQEIAVYLKGKDS